MLLCSPACNRRARRFFPASEIPADELHEKLAAWHDEQAAKGRAACRR